MDAMTNDLAPMIASAVSISSSADRFFYRGNAPVAASPITIAVVSDAPAVSNGGSLAVSIPAGFAMAWDETNRAPTFEGTAKAKVDTTVGYTNANRTLNIAVTDDFATNDTLIVSALSFKDYLGFGAARLELDFDGDGAPDAQDDKDIAIIGFYYTGAEGANYALDQTINDRRLENQIGSVLSIR